MYNEFKKRGDTMQYYGISDIGKKREENQDKIYMGKEGEEVGLFILADGMGGAKAGSVASSTAVEYVKNYVHENISEIWLERENIEKLLRKAIFKANNYVYEKSKTSRDYTGMGTTMIAVLTYHNKVYIGHIGDSRVYRIRKNIIRQLTKDHSYVQALVDNGSITKEEAMEHPQRNVLLRVLGCEKNEGADIITKGFLKDDFILICTDGLTNMMDTKDIYDTIVRNKNNVKVACEKLIKEANELGGFDNVSAILISND